MQNNPITLAVLDATGVRRVLKLDPSGKASVKAFAGAKFVLAEEASGVGPAHIRTERHGDHLYVFLDDAAADAPQLVIHRYYAYDSVLAGQAEDGSFYAYASADGAAAEGTGSMTLDGAFLGSFGYGPGAFGAEGTGGMGASGLKSASGLAGWLQSLGTPTALGLGAAGLAGVAWATGVIGKDDKKHDPDQGQNEQHPGQDGHFGPKAVLDSVVDDVGSSTGALEFGDYTDDTTPTFSGKGLAGNRIEIWSNGSKIGETQVDNDGNWTFTPPELKDGKQSVTVVEVDRNGQKNEPSDPFEFIVDTVAPGRATIDPVDTSTDGHPVLTGTGEAGSLIVIKDKNGNIIAQGTIGDDGTWSLTPDQPLSPGSHELIAVVHDQAGNIGLPSVPVTVNIEPDIGSRSDEGVPAVHAMESGTDAHPHIDDRHNDTSPHAGDMPFRASMATPHLPDLFETKVTPTDDLAVSEHGTLTLTVGDVLEASGPDFFMPDIAEPAVDPTVDFHDSLDLIDESHGIGLTGEGTQSNVFPPINPLVELLLPDGVTVTP